MSRDLPAHPGLFGVPKKPWLSFVSVYDTPEKNSLTEKLYDRWNPLLTGIVSM